jgi:hypothetical protein
MLWAPERFLREFIYHKSVSREHEDSSSKNRRLSDEHYKTKRRFSIKCSDFDKISEIYGTVTLNKLHGRYLQKNDVSRCSLPTAKFSGRVNFCCFSPAQSLLVTRLEGLTTIFWSRATLCLRNVDFLEIGFTGRIYFIFVWHSVTKSGRRGGCVFGGEVS